MILTHEQEMIRDSMRAFAQERLAPSAADWDRNHTFPAEALKEPGAGAMGMVVPEQWGGAGMDYMSLVLTLEEIAAGDGATSTIVSVQNRCLGGIPNRLATTRKGRMAQAAGPRRKPRLLLPHRAAHRRRRRDHHRADRDGDDYVLNGVGHYITTGKHADVAIVFAVTDKAAGSKFLLPGADRDARLQGRPHRTENGAAPSDTAQIVFRELPRAGCPEARCSARKAKATRSPSPTRGRLVSASPPSRSAWRARPSEARWPIPRSASPSGC